MAAPMLLFGIGIKEWVLQTAARMDEPTSLNEKSHWALAWRETYCKLGGRRASCGDKGCPRAAAYALWYLGRLTPCRREPMWWPITRVASELGRNAAYAVIAADLYAETPGRSTAETWLEVRRRFRNHCGADAAISEQGQVRIAAALAAAGVLSSRGRG